MSGFPSISVSTSQFSSPLFNPNRHAIVPSGSSRPLHAPITISAAIARFKPTPKEIINGIAPHVLDERKRRRRRSRSPSRTVADYMQPKLRAKSCSPLRLSAVIAVDSDGESVIIELEQSEHHHHCSCSLTHGEGDRTLKAPPGCAPVSETTQPAPEISDSNNVIVEARPRRFRMNKMRIFRTIGVILKSSPKA